LNPSKSQCFAFSSLIIFLDTDLADRFDERSCQSRYKSPMYRCNPGRKLWSYLVSKLWRQEALQRQGGPNTYGYSADLKELKSGEERQRHWLVGVQLCKYLLSFWYSGLGNRILAVIVTFLLAWRKERLRRAEVGTVLEPKPILSFSVGCAVGQTRCFFRAVGSPREVHPGGVARAVLWDLSASKKNPDLRPDRTEFFSQPGRASSGIGARLLSQSSPLPRL
jgi:hypothetical protein